MKKVLRMMAMLFGAVVMVFGVSSCSKDDKSCCEFENSNTDNDVTYTTKIEVCEDGTFTSTSTSTDSDNNVTVTGNWKDEDEDLTWSYIKDEYCS